MGKYVEYIKEIGDLTDEVVDLTHENRRLKAKLKQQYKRAKLAEYAQERYSQDIQRAIDRFHDAERKIQTVKASRDQTEQIGRRLFAMLEHALEIKAKGI